MQWNLVPLYICVFVVATTMEPINGLFEIYYFS
jgi:hypothetical protein